MATDASRFCCCCYYYLLFLVVGFLLPACAICRSPDEAFAFSFDGGLEENGTFGAVIALRGGAKIRGSAVVLGGPAEMMSRRPARFFGARPGFSAYLSFASAPGGDGPAFFLVPAVAYAGANSSEVNGTAASPPAAAAIQVEFLAGMDRKDGNFSRMLIGIRVGNQDLIRSRDLPGDLDGGGKKLHAWIDYDGDNKRVHVRLSESKEPKPRNATVSYQIDLSDILWRNPMLVGMSSSNASSPPQSCSIYGWSFTTRRGTPYLLHSDPLDPDSSLKAVRPIESGAPDGAAEGGSGGYPLGTITGMLFAAACGALVTFFVMFVWFAAMARRPIAFVQYPVHPVPDVVYDKIVVVGSKGEEEGTNSRVLK